MIDNRKKELIAQTVIKILYSRFKSFPSSGSTNRNAPFHDAFLEAFADKLSGRVTDVADYISLSSWMHGLNTTLGESFFESVAHILSDGIKKEFEQEQIYAKQVSEIANIMADLKNSKESPNLIRENNIINNARNGKKQSASNFTVDCFYETGKEVVAIELKSVRPNSGEMRGEKQKILQAKAVLKELYPGKEIKYYFGFPFDPTSSTDTGSDKTRFMNNLVEASKFIDPSEMLLADELWSHLGGASSGGVMSELLHIINTIATPQFMEKYEAIQDKTVGYENILNEWFLESERFIFDHTDKIPDTYKRIARQSIFKTDGSYNERRFELYAYLKANP